MKKLKVVGVIPARMSASRYPGKPLEKILGLPMVEHVRRRALLVDSLDDVIVATCDDEIRNVVEGYGGKVVMTSDKHERATDRIAEAVGQIECDVVLNIQGDEPMVTAKPLEALIQPFRDNPETVCTCIVYPIRDLSELNNLNIVKTVMSKSGRLLYLSRSGIPGRDPKTYSGFLKQSGLMGFTKKSLKLFTQLESTPLEKQESVDLLRLLEHDLWVQGVFDEKETKGVDVPSQVKEVEDAIMSDPVQKSLFEKIVRMA